jgi:TIR domain
MGYVPGYENDVFISYAHADNEPILPDKPGWVDFFEDLLRKRVKVRLRGEIQFFRDQQLRLYRKFSDQLAEKLASSAVLICIPTPNYVGSDWCLWELEQFHKLMGSGRIIKVVKTHFDEQNLKPSARSLLKQIEHVLDSRFYIRNESTGLIDDLLPEVNPAHVLVCLQKIEVIAQNLVELFKKLCAAGPGPSSPVRNFSDSAARRASR